MLYSTNREERTGVISLKTNFESQILEIFGTTNIDELRKISKEASSYRQNVQTNYNIGRKNSFTEPQIAEIVALHAQGEKISAIAQKFKVSRQTIYNQIKRAHQFSEDPDVKMRMNFMNRNKLCTTINIDFKHEKIEIHNYTEQIPLRAFGVVTNPTWDDFEYFLEDRCFPRTRDHAKEILREMNLPFYDPLLIVEKTQGRMEGDHQWIMILHREDGTL